MSGKFLIQPGFDRFAQNVNKKLDGYVPNERKINGKPLSEDVTLTASDVGAITASQLDNAIRTHIRTKWRSGWPDVWYNPIADTGRASLARVAPQPTYIYGVTWDGSSTTKWARTDDSSGFADPVPYVAGATEYGSPFDNIMPWKGMVREERAGGTMVAIPKFWYKLEQNTPDTPSSGMTIQVANEPIEGFSVSPAHMDRGDGKGERDVVYIGRYHCAASDYKSKTGVLPQGANTYERFQTNIHTLGSTIWMVDFAMRFTIWLLYLVEFADWDSQKTIGKGCGDNSNTGNMGYTDSMPYHTGTTQSSRDTYGLGTQYRNIEGLWDNVYDCTDGCYGINRELNIVLNPNNFGSATGGVSIGSIPGGFSSVFTVTDNAGFPVFYPSTCRGSATTYSCDYWTYIDDNLAYYAGGDIHEDADYGLFHYYSFKKTDAYATLGSRLQELP